MKISQKQKTKNTDELFAYFAKGYERAKTEPKDWLREISLKSARDSEWHTLFSCLLVESMRPLYDGGRVADRLDEMKNAMMRKPAANAADKCEHEWSVDEQSTRRCIGCGEAG